MFCVLLALCSVEAQAYGGNTYGHTRYAYLKLNGVVVWRASWYGEYPVNRGVNMMIVDPSSCTLQEWRKFDIFVLPDTAARLRDYLQAQSDETILVGVTCDTAHKHLSDALPTLSALGVNVSDVGFYGAWVFAAVKGDPSKTVLEKQLNLSAEANATQPRINVTFGKCDHTLHGSARVF